jgi:hypothetical protein
MVYLIFWDVKLHDGYLVSDNSGKSTELKMSGTKPREAASSSKWADTLFTKLQKQSGLKCNDPNAP